MKRILSLTLCLLMLLPLFISCGSSLPTETQTATEENASEKTSKEETKEKDTYK